MTFDTKSCKIEKGMNKKQIKCTQKIYRGYLNKLPQSLDIYVNVLIAPAPFNQVKMKCILMQIQL